MATKKKTTASKRAPAKRNPIGDDRMSVRDRFVAALAPSFAMGFLSGHGEWDSYDDLAESIGFAADALMFERKKHNRGQKT